MALGMIKDGDGVDEDINETVVVSWEDLPSAVLCHILTIIPYKRLDVKAVCSSWRQAINSSINSVSIPAADLRLLSHLPNIKRLTVRGAAVVQQHKQCSQQSSGAAEEPSGSSAQGARCPVAAWPPAAAPQHAASNRSCSKTGTDWGQQQHGQQQETQQRQQQLPNVWSLAAPKLFSHLVTLELLHCPQVVQQLANTLRRPGGGDSMQPQAAAFSSLRVLKLAGTTLGPLDRLFSALLHLQQQQQQQQHKGSGVESSAAVTHCNSYSSPGGVALHRLDKLFILGYNEPGPSSSQLEVLLQQLPALQVLQLSSCAELVAVPPVVCGCSQLTRLVLSHNELITHLPQHLSHLTALRDLDLTGCAMLQSLGPGFSSITSLTTLNLSGPSGLWLDYSASQPAHTAAAAATNQMVAASGCNSGSAAAARAALPQLLLPPLPHQQQRQLLPELASLSQLHTLNLSNNRQLMVVPACVSVLTGLAVLNVGGCGVRWLGDDVLECGGLQQLLLRDNVLAEVPEDISRLTRLKVLDIGACCSLWSLPRSLLLLAALEQLIVPSKAIGQHVLEQLELRGSNPVEVLIDPADSEDDEEDGEGAGFGEALSSGSSSGDEVSVGDTQQMPRRRPW